jgi:hypothetical protein
VRAYVAAIRNGDCRTIFGLFSDRTLNRFGVERGQAVSDCAIVAQNLATTFAGLTVVKLVVKSQDDHEAEVVVTVGVGTETATRPVFLIREGNRWRIDVRIIQT